MSRINYDFTGCSVLIYDEEGTHLCDTTVTYYDKKTLIIGVEESPAGLDEGDACRLLILTSPAPCVYRGRIILIGKSKLVAMYDGKKREKREDSRYTVKLPAIIENYICDDKVYPLHTHIAVEMIDISKNGARLRMPSYALSTGDKFRMSVRINNRYRNVIAEVKNHTHSGTEAYEYGCRFLFYSDGGVCHEQKRAI